MRKLLQIILDWSEVWAPVMPLLILGIRRKQPVFLYPVILYLWFALFINLAGNLISVFWKYLPLRLQTNNPLYNLHSVIRFLCFSFFFITQRRTAFSSLQKILLFLFLFLVVVNFSYFEDFNNFNYLSGNLFAGEAYILLVYCMQYYLSQLKDEVETISSGPDFWIVTGLSIYVVINFFVFLFYVPMITENPFLAESMWNVHNIAYIIFCIFISKAFYEPVRHQLTV